MAVFKTTKGRYKAQSTVLGYKGSYGPRPSRKQDETGPDAVTQSLPLFPI